MDTTHSAEEPFRLGCGQLEAERHADALEQFRTTQRLDPTNACFRSYYGLCLGLVERRFDRALELSAGLDAAPYVTFAAGVSQPAEDRTEFQQLLQEALAIDPDEDTSLRLLNLVNQKRAQALLDHIDDLFFDPLGTEETLP